MLQKNIKLSKPEDALQLEDIDPFLGIVLFATVAATPRQYRPLMVTSITGDAPGRESRTHEEGRAIDIDTEKIPSEVRRSICDVVNAIFGAVWGTSPDGKDPKVLIYHRARWMEDGKWKVGRYHIHTQVRRGLIMSDLFGVFKVPLDAPSLL